MFYVYEMEVFEKMDEEKVNLTRLVNVAQGPGKAEKKIAQYIKQRRRENNIPDSIPTGYRYVCTYAFRKWTDLQDAVSHRSLSI